MKLSPSRRSVLMFPLAFGALLTGCAGDSQTGREENGSAVSLPDTTPPTTSTVVRAPAPSFWAMPAEETQHARTWMCWPSSDQVWGSDLAEVQDTIIEIALTIARFEPVTMLARPEEVEALTELVGSGVTVVEAPVDDLWARDTLPAFLTQQTNDTTQLAAGRVRFNGWGDKQIHDGDAMLAQVVADYLDIELIDSGIYGEGGGLEIDGAGTIVAAESSWVNENRNPGLARGEIEQTLLTLLGAERMIWVDGLAGADITDGHIDTLARFANATTIVIDKPAYNDPEDPWVKVAARTKEQILSARTKAGEPYQVVEIVQPNTVRQQSDGFLSTYMNYYVCNGAVIAPEFGDKTSDAAALKVLGGLFPGRKIVQLNIDALAAGGGGIHCATQQQPISSLDALTGFD